MTLQLKQQKSLSNAQNNSNGVMMDGQVLV